MQRFALLRVGRRRDDLLEPRRKEKFRGQRLFELRHGKAILMAIKNIFIRTIIINNPPPILRPACKPKTSRPRPEPTRTSERKTKDIPFRLAGVDYSSAQ